MLRRKILRIAAGALAAVAIVSLAACSDDEPTGPDFENPSTIIVENQLFGPVLFFRVRACGTSDWGDDLLPLDPVEGTIQPGDSKNFTVEAGCYDLQAQHLETTDPGPLLTKEDFDRVASPVTPITWVLEELPAGPS
ncbi:MAG: hypothetical protein R3195_11475 [Gemmatimonadota bacterium]|nr:hypothetical protein [Gemmatimonadota bacterium]